MGGEGKELLEDGVGKYHHADAHVEKSTEIGKDVFNNLVALHK